MLHKQNAARISIILFKKFQYEIETKLFISFFIFWYKEAYLINVNKQCYFIHTIKWQQCYSVDKYQIKNIFFSLSEPYLS